MDQLDGCCVAVTGAGSGIGRALALAFAAVGARVAIADVETAALDATAAMVRDHGAEVLAETVDVANAEQVVDFATRIDTDLGGADVVCNNAGVFAGGLVWERPIEDFEWVLGVNFYGVLHGIRAFVPGMIERGRPGHVVNTISAAGLIPSAFSAPYTVSKFATFALTECLAGELASVGAPIGVTALCPGAVKTGIASSSRNRAVAPPPDAASEFVGRILAENTDGGMPPESVAVMVLDAIRTGRYLQLTSDGYTAALRTRTDELLSGVVPVLPHFD